MSNFGTYYIQTFGCQANEADSERAQTALIQRGMRQARSLESADYVLINTCMVRESAQNRVYGLLRNLHTQRQKTGKPQKIVLTGCMVGLAIRERSGKGMKRLREKLPHVDEFLAIDEIGFDYIPHRADKKRALIPISNGCNNFCTFCIVPYARGKEVSRGYEDILKECRKAKQQGYREVMLLGQNVNSYGADLLRKSPAKQAKYSKRDVVYVKHLGKYRIPTLFPQLLEEVAQMNFVHIDFMSSNPWDFSDELMRVIAQNRNITRTLHIPLQSGDDKILAKMKRWYTAEEYVHLIEKIRATVPEVTFTTDIIVGFPTETKTQFAHTIRVCKRVGFKRAFVSRYSPRPGTYAHKHLTDNVPPEEKKRRWEQVNELINSGD